VACKKYDPRSSIITVPEFVSTRIESISPLFLLAKAVKIEDLDDQLDGK
jgi:hypothetical protein